MTRALLLILAAAAVLVALAFERPHPTPGPPARDFEAYYAAGVLWLHGASPYGTQIWNVEKTLDGVSAQRYEVLPYVGPPALLPLFGAFARLSFANATAVWRMLLAASIAAIVLLTLRLARLPLSPLHVLAGSVAALGFGPITSALALGQIALPAFVFAALAVYRKPAAVLAWAQPNVALALLALCKRRKDALALAAALAVFLLACLAVAGPAGMAGYAHLLREHGAAERFSAIQITPAAIAYGFGAPESVAIATGLLVAAAACAVWLLLMTRIEDAAARFCATCALLPLAMPFFHEHDLLVTFAAAVFFTLRASSRAWPIAATGALLCATDWLGLAQRPDGAVQTLLLVGACGAALAALRADIRPRMVAAPIAVLAIVAGAAWIGHLHPAPVWPDAMAALPRNAASLDISAAWHAQQAATGLFARNAFWALLRCGSLLGCALLTYAAAISSRSPARSKSPLPVPA